MSANGTKYVRLRDFIVAATTVTSTATKPLHITNLLFSRQPRHFRVAGLETNGDFRASSVANHWMLQLPSIKTVLNQFLLHVVLAPFLLRSVLCVARQVSVWSVAFSAKTTTKGNYSELASQTARNILLGKRT